MTSADSDHWQRQAGQVLMTVIKDRSVITYNQLATAAKLSGPHRIHRLTIWLEQTMTEDHLCGRPLRAAVVISRARGGLPAPGFFSFAQTLGIDFSTADRPTAYRLYLEQLYDSLA